MFLPDQRFPEVLPLATSVHFKADQQLMVKQHLAVLQDQLAACWAKQKDAFKDKDDIDAAVRAKASSDEVAAISLPVMENSAVAFNVFQDFARFMPDNTLEASELSVQWEVAVTAVKAIMVEGSVAAGVAQASGGAQDIRSQQARQPLQRLQASFAGVLRPGQAKC